MVVLISKDGKHRCNARCYNATWFKCKCICNGKNHGVGLDQAFKNSEESNKPNDDKLLEAWADFILNRNKQLNSKA